MFPEQKNSPQPKRMSFFLWPSLLLLITITGFLARTQLAPVDSESAREITLEIPKTASTAQIASLLEQEGLINSALAFRLYTRYQNVDGSLKPGVYVLSTSMSVGDMIKEMLKGPDNTIRITIPEGFTIAQIAELMESKGIIGREEFLRLTEQEWSYPFVKDIPVKRNKLEGYLYPDTYYINSDTSPEKVLQMMLDRFQAVIIEHDYIKQAEKRGLTLHEAVTFASMVEREAKVANERARIAGVIYNRMEKGMPLQIDATIQYVLEEPREVLLYKDLEIDSPFNTYKHAGLPPGPIACPGWPSLQAVIEPEKHDFLYYVAKPDGSHAFSRTLAEHNTNIRKYQ